MGTQDSTILLQICPHPSCAHITDGTQPPYAKVSGWEATLFSSCSPEAEPPSPNPGRLFLLPDAVKLLRAVVMSLCHHPPRAQKNRGQLPPGVGTELPVSQGAVTLVDLTVHYSCRPSMDVQMKTK